MTPEERTAFYAAASRHLAALDEDWERLVERVGPCLMELKQAREPYEALARAVAYQQLHGKVAEAILGRWLALFPGAAFPSPAAILALDMAAFRACGFSVRKAETIRGIAEGTLSGLVPSLAAAREMPDEELIARLVTLKGIGRWTVEMLLIFSLGRTDVLPVDDFGVREGYRLIKDLDAPITPKALAQACLPCRPYRSVAAWYLWRAKDTA